MNFDRQYRLIAGQAGCTGFEVGDDSTTPLHISFSLEKADVESQNTGKISIWNLNDEHIAELNKDDCIISLKAGYGTTMPLIFTGVITYVITYADGADRCTEIEIVDNRIEIRDTYMSVTYTRNVSTKTLIEEVASQMGVAVTFSYNAEFSNFANGFSYVGAATNIISKACDSSDLVWSIQNGVLQVKKPQDTMNQSVYVLSADTGLVSIPQKVQISDETSSSQHGWDVEYLMNAAINVDDLVKIESQTVTGIFRVYSVSIEGDNLGDTWRCTARVLEVDE